MKHNKLNTNPIDLTITFIFKNIFSAFFQARSDQIRIVGLAGELCSVQLPVDATLQVGWKTILLQPQERLKSTFLCIDTY